MGGISSVFMGSKKRRREESDDEEEIRQKHLRPSKRLKPCPVMNPKVIYEELYKVGLYSDIKISASGKEWNLHKPILKQCHYFDVMLSGPWKEANQDVIHIELVDPNITLEALEIVFGSLYCNDLTIDKDNVINVVAAASHFQTDALVTRCGEVMNENMTNYNIMKYYAIAQQYGIPLVEEHATTFLLRNIVCNKYFWPVLHEISVDLMARLVEDPQLVVAHAEYLVYRLLLRWLHSHIHAAPSHCRNSDIHKFYKNLPGTQDFLSTENGLKYQPAFRKLRLGQILVSSQIITHVMKTRVIPKEWVLNTVLQNHLETLRVHEGHDRGPNESHKYQLATRGVRFGRTLKKGEGTWKWHTMLVGLDLSWCIHNNTLEVWRSRAHDAPMFTNSVHERRIIVRVRFISVSIRKTPCFVSDILCISLPINQRVEVLKIPDKVKYPAVLCVELLLTSNDPAPELNEY